MAAEIRLFTCLTDNFGYLVHDSETGATASVDAPEAAPIIAALAREGWTLTDILVTHHHGDHVGGVGELKQKYGCRVVAPHDQNGKIPEVDLRVAQGDVVKVGGLLARVLETPGHTLDHLAYVFDDDKAVFAGDTLFSIGCGRVFEGTYPMMWDSLLKLRGAAGRHAAVLRPRVHRRQRQIRARRRAEQCGAAGARRAGERRCARRGSRRFRRCSARRSRPTCSCAPTSPRSRPGCG